MRKLCWNIIVNLLLSLALSLTVTIATNIFNGIPINGMTVGFPLVLATIIGTLVTTILPVAKIGMKFAAWNHAGPGTALCSIYKNFVILAIMVPIMNFFVVGIMLGFFTQDFFNAWLYPIPTVYPVGYVTALLFEPIALWVATKITRLDPFAAPEGEKVAVAG